MVTLPNGETYIFIKGASEYILKSCDKIIDLNSAKIYGLDPD